MCECAMADAFLKEAKASIMISYIGRGISALWGDKIERNMYYVTIKTPRGAMSLTFWDSVHNTEISKLSLKDFARMRGVKCNVAVPYAELSKLQQELNDMQASAKPTPYAILACLTKYGHDTFDEFCAEYGYDNDSIRALKTYIACSEEYNKVLRVFTTAQIKALREIN